MAYAPGVTRNQLGDDQPPLPAAFCIRGEAIWLSNKSLHLMEAFGSLAISWERPMALRPHLAMGLPLSMPGNKRIHIRLTQPEAIHNTRSSNLLRTMTENTLKYPIKHRAASSLDRTNAAPRKPLSNSLNLVLPCHHTRRTFLPP